MKKVLFSICTLLLAINLYSFDWPQKVNSNLDNLYLFCEEREGDFNNGIIFKDQAPVIVSDSGLVIVKISDNVSETGRFNSTLGNCIVIAHSDQLLTIYGGLSEINLPEDLENISEGYELGISGNSGWHKEDNALEFQVIDIKDKKLINPIVLMPKTSEHGSLQVRNITATNKNGTTYDLSNQRYLPSGTYFFYRAVSGIMPFKTTVLINGAKEETITYDVLTQQDTKIFIKGNKLYPVTSVYPESNKHLLSEMNLTKGRVTLSFIIYDINGNETQANYILDIF